MRARLYLETFERGFSDHRASAIGLEERIDTIVPATTELPLLIRTREPEGMKFLDTMLIHVAPAVDVLIKDR